MKNLKKIIDFLVDSNIWVAISVIALLRITNISLSLDSNYYLQLFVFTSVIFGYNFIKHFTLQYLTEFKSFVANFSSKLLFKWFEQLKKESKVIFFINTLSVAISCFCFFKLKIFTQCLILVPLLLSVFYTISFGNKTLRNIEGLKIYVVSFVWAIVTVLVPVEEFSFDFSGEIWLVFLQRFLFVLALILPFEIRDMLLDPRQLRTVPQKIGVQNTKIYGLFLLLIFLLLAYLNQDQLDISVFVISIITSGFLLFANKKQSTYYSSFFVEGIPILWYVLLVVF